jgi:hypothetical protein
MVLQGVKPIAPRTSIVAGLFQDLFLAKISLPSLRLLGIGASYLALPYLVWPESWVPPPTVLHQTCDDCNTVSSRPNSRAEPLDHLYPAPKMMRMEAQILLHPGESSYFPNRRFRPRELASYAQGPKYPRRASSFLRTSGASDLLKYICSCCGHGQRNFNSVDHIGRQCATFPP